MRNKHAGMALRVCLLYAAGAALWIVLSDELLGYFVSDPRIVREISIFKGWGFVGFTAWLLYLSFRRQLRLYEREMTGRKSVDASLQKTNRALAMISGCNQILIRSSDEAQLLKSVCNLLVSEGGYAMAWAGYPRDDAKKSVEPVAQAGPKAGLLEALVVTWADEPSGRGPIGTALRTGQTSIRHDLGNQKLPGLWLEEARRHGYKSAIGLPLTANGKTFGALGIFSAQADAFHDAEAALLTEMAEDLAYGIIALRARTEYQRAEQDLRRSEERLRLAQAASKTGIFDVDLVRDYATWTEEEEAIFGFAPGTFDHTSKTFWSLLHPEDRGRIQRVAEAAIASGNEFSAEYRFYRHDNHKMRWAMVRGKAVYDSSGRPTRMLGVNIDITESKYAEEALQTSEALYHSLVEQMPAGIFRKDAEGRYAFANSQFWRMTNNQPADVLGKLPADARQTGATSQDDSVRHHQQIMQTGKSIEMEETHQGADGVTRHVHAVKSPVFDSQGKIIGSQGILFDITRLKAAEDAYVRLAAAVEQAAEDIIITDATGSILYVNPAFEAVTGYSRTEVIGRNPRLLKSGKHDAVFYQNMWAVLARGEVWSGHIINRKKDGTLFEEKASISPIRNPAGAIISYVGVRRDITREAALEAQLRQAQKMEAIGQLAGGVAHDFNNLLTAIHANASLLLDEPLERDELTECSREILEAAERAATLTRQLLMFSRKQVMQPVNLDLNEVVAQMTKLLQRILGEDITLSSNYGPNLPVIHADAGMIEQIILNLAVNSRDAMPLGGRLVITTDSGELDERRAKDTPGAAPGPYVRLTITDNGCGIPAEHLSRIFEPFFTTKEVGKGTGLGLATVYGIVQQHRGWIEVASEVNQGTTFRIYFPAVTGAKAGRSPVSTGSKLPRGNETILLVEDEDMVRFAVYNTLQRCGYSVLQAESGVVALEVWRRFKDQIQLLLTDIVMPDGMTGYDLARQLQADKPPLKVIYASGYTGELPSKRSTLVEGVNFLQKPFNPEKLATTVRRSLDAK